MLIKLRQMTLRGFLAEGLAGLGFQLLFELEVVLWLEVGWPDPESI